MSGDQFLYNYAGWLSCVETNACRIILLEHITQDVPALYIHSKLDSLKCEVKDHDIL